MKYYLIIAKRYPNWLHTDWIYAFEDDAGDSDSFTWRFNLCMRTTQHKEDIRALSSIPCMLAVKNAAGTFQLISEQEALARMM